MTEAVKRIVQYAFEDLKIDLLTAFHYPENIQSKKVLERCGFTYEATIENGCEDYSGVKHDAVCHSIFKDDYFSN